ncbi:hypothetical protein ENSA5_57660 [Enhygromyxa salina]|uniref:Uncharacterized protein n=1 Tax=Enhygromyxa salina TaxID=215803 RepID=A0A2S9XEA2_9BACT|nr:hypothetical protein ENSA5_57660 [Enhygromyxa salina]
MPDGPGPVDGQALAPRGGAVCVRGQNRSHSSSDAVSDEVLVEGELRIGALGGD